MNLADFLDGARQTLHALFVVESPRGYTLVRGMISDYSADRLTALCVDDAGSLERGRRHTYRVIARSEDGIKETRFSLNVEGASEAVGDGHGIDVDKGLNERQLVAQLARIVVESNKIVRDVVRDLSSELRTARSESEHTRRESLRLGKWQVQARELDLLAEESRAEREKGSAFTDKLLPEIVALARPLLLRTMGASGQATALDDFKQSLTDAQRETIVTALGAAKGTKLLTLTSAADVVALLDTLSEPESQALVGMLDERQRLTLGQALQPAIAAREAAKAKANGAAKEAVS